MGVHDPLRHARGARGIDDVARAVADQRDPAGQVRLRRRPRPEVGPAIACRSGQIAACDQRVGQIARDGIDPRCLIVGGEHGPGAAIADHGGHGLVGDRQVQRHRTGPGLHDAEQHLDHGPTVAHRHRDHVAGAQPQPGHTVGDPVGGGIEVGPAEGLAVDDQRRLGRLPPGVQRDDVRQQRIVWFKARHWAPIGWGQKPKPEPKPTPPGSRPARARCFERGSDAAGACRRGRRQAHGGGTLVPSHPGLQAGV